MVEIEPCGVQSARHRTRATSTQMVRDIFMDGHFKLPARVLDVTFSLGRMWAWPYQAMGIQLLSSDLNPGRHPGIQTQYVWDFRQLPASDDCYDIVVFDPPFTSAGSSDWAWGYGLDRKRGGPQNTHETGAWLLAGTREALRVARHGLILKFKDCVESGRPTRHLDDAREIIKAAGWDIVAEYTTHGNRPQPEGRNYTNDVQPTVYVVARERLQGQRPRGRTYCFAN